MSLQLEARKFVMGLKLPPSTPDWGPRVQPILRAKGFLKSGPRSPALLVTERHRIHLLQEQRQGGVVQVQGQRGVLQVLRSRRSQIQVCSWKQTGVLHIR
jgi:hypothetical protein